MKVEGLPSVPTSTLALELEPKGKAEPTPSCTFCGTRVPQGLAECAVCGLTESDPG
jgi:hypothetical protein